MKLDKKTVAITVSILGSLIIAVVFIILVIKNSPQPLRNNSRIMSAG